jgi:ABC-type glycerol-3-phosphate transport system substrate-binding protein
MATHKLSRRRFLGIGTSALGSSLLAACGAAPTASNQPAATIAPTAAPAVAEKVALDVYVHPNHPFDLVKPLFEQQYPNITLNMLGQNDFAAFRATLAAQGAGTPDIIWPEPAAIQEMGPTGVLLDVTDIVNQYKDMLAPGKLSECYINATGTYAAFPGDIAAVCLYYREDLLEQAGITTPLANDWSWDEYIEMGQKLKQDSDVFSFYLPTGGGQDTAIPWTYFLAQLGGSFTNADGSEITVNTPQGLAATQLLKKVWDAQISVDGSAFSDVFFGALKGNKFAVLPAPSWYRAFGLEANITTAEEGGFGAWRTALLPRPAPGAARTANWGGANIISTRYTQHPQEVMDFMAFAMASDEGARAVADYGTLPPYLPFLRSDDWKTMRRPLFGDFPFNEAFGQAAEEYPTTWYKTAIYFDALNETGNLLLPILKGEVEAEAGLTAIDTRLREVLTRYQQGAATS